MYHFNRRTAGPLGPSPAPGCDKPTSRCQPAPSMCTLGRDKPVIPSVPFIRCAIARPRGATGSLRPTFVAARAVALAVRRPSSVALAVRLPTALRAPSRASVTLSEATAPVKLPACHGPGEGPPHAVRAPHSTGWYFTGPSPEAGAPGSTPPTYA